MLLSGVKTQCQPRKSQQRSSGSKRAVFVQASSNGASKTTKIDPVILRGHGKNVWKDAGWDWEKTTLTKELQELLLTYGQLAQITYDKLGQDPCNRQTYGYTEVQDPRHLLDGLTAHYPLKQGAQPSSPKGVRDMYTLPIDTDQKLNPLIHAVPGKLQDVSVAQPDNPISLNPLDWAWFAKVYDQVGRALAGFVDSGSGGHSLFREPGPNGRGKLSRGAFMGYVAVSKPDKVTGGVDVALVWRGTIFREEWENNFAQNQLDKWVKDPHLSTLDAASKRAAALDSDPSAREPKSPSPNEVGVHDGFEDLYNRPTTQWPSAKHPEKAKLSPREVVQQWLLKLMTEQKVTTITTTGHSLGGALSTLCAYDVLEWLDAVWNDPKTNKSTWATKEKPYVTCISWAAPRVGNAKFHMEFNRLGGRCLRVVNKGDVVPRVPGVFATLVLSLFERLRILGRRTVLDTDFSTLAFIRTLSYWFGRVVPFYKNPWAYWHIGQVLELDVTKAPADEPALKPLEENKRAGEPFLGVGQLHNLELYLYLVSALGPNGWETTTSRNALLLNKSDDVLQDEKTYPAVWWTRADTYGVEKLSDGSWQLKHNKTAAATNGAVNASSANKAAATT